MSLPEWVWIAQGLTDNGTDAKHEAKSGAGGTYSFVNLNPGTYSVTVTQKGFQSYTRAGVEVQIGRTTRADIVLQVGNVAQSVTVSAAPSDLHTDSDTLSALTLPRSPIPSHLRSWQPIRCARNITCCRPLAG